MPVFSTSLMWLLVQVNIDFESEQDMVEKARIGLALQPVATALFANSPFRDGKPTGDKAFCYLITTHKHPSDYLWLHTTAHLTWLENPSATDEHQFTLEQLYLRAFHKQGPQLPLVFLWGQ